MRKIIILIFLLSFITVADDELHLSLIDGQWHCSDNFDEGDITGKVVSRYSYDSAALTYSLYVKTEFIYQGRLPFGVVNVVERGKFSYQSSKITYTPLTVVAEVAEDPLEYFTSATLEQMESELLETDNTAYQTMSINKLEWQTLDPTDNTKSLCLRNSTNS